jgi:hypothetical protein
MDNTNPIKTREWEDAFRFIFVKIRKTHLNGNDS